MATKPVALPYPDTLETIGDHLKTRRLDLGLHQRDVAEHLGITTDSVMSWEKNYCTPKLYLLPRIINLLGHDPRPEPAESLSFGQRIVRARRRLGLPQKALARQLDVDPTTLYYWEHDLRQPVPENRAKLEAFVESNSTPDSRSYVERERCSIRAACDMNRG